MGKIETVTVGLPVEAVEAVRRAVASGDYPTESDAVAAALRLWTDAQEQVRLDSEVLATLWDEGLASGPGRFATMDALVAEAETRQRKPAS